MLMRLSLLLFVPLVSQTQLFAQCENCDSLAKVLEAKEGIHFYTNEEISNNPSLLISGTKMDCATICARVHSGGNGIHFSGKWGYVSLRTGVNYDQLKTSGSFVGGFRFDRVRQKYFSIAFDLDAPEWGGFIVRLELAWKPHDFNGAWEVAQEKRQTRWNIRANAIGKEVSFLYKTTKGKIRWFAGAGLGKDRLYIKQNTWTDYSDGIPTITETRDNVYNKNWFTSLSAGLMIRNRVEIRYKRLGAQCSAQTSQFSIKNISNIITAGFRL